MRGQQVEHVAGVLFLDAQDALDHGAGGGVVIATLLYLSLDQLLGRAATWTAALRGPR